VSEDVYDGSYAEEAARDPGAGVVRRGGEREPGFIGALDEANLRTVIAAYVKELREKAEITQAELAAKIGTTQPGVARVEAGKTMPDLATLHKIACAASQMIDDKRKAAAPPKGNRRSVSGSLAARPGADKRIVAQHEDVRHSRGARAMGRSRRRPSSPGARRTR
jgi:transcriptional regulator with XRE-family HTH domain